jgi:hypothetical protein
MRLFVLLPMLAIIAFQAPAFAADYKCTAAKWVYNPYYGPNGYYTMSLSSECTVSNAAGKGVTGVYDYWLNHLTKDTQVVVPPVAAEFNGLPGSTLTVWDNYKAGGDSIKVKNEFHLGTDKSTRFSSASYSKEIQASGFTAFLRYLEANLDVTGTSANTYKVIIAGTIQIEKPVFFPTDAFENQAKQAATDAYAQQRLDLIKTVAGTL